MFNNVARGFELWAYGPNLVWGGGGGHSLPDRFAYTVHIQLFQLRLSTSEAEKSNTSAKGCWESLTN